VIGKHRDNFTFTCTIYYYVQLYCITVPHFMVTEMCGDMPGSSSQPGCQNRESRLLRALQLLFLLLPPENRVLLKDILQLLHLTASHEGKNKMSADSLATLFTPHLLCPRKVQLHKYCTNMQ